MQLKPDHPQTEAIKIFHPYCRQEDIPEQKNADHHGSAFSKYFTY